MVRTAKLMSGVGKQLEIPTLATEQYPKAFGATVRVCRWALGSDRLIDGLIDPNQYVCARPIQNDHRCRSWM